MEFVSSAKKIIYDVFGPTVEFLTLPGESTNYGILKGTIPQGISIPLHSHPDDESFYILSGTIKLIRQMNKNYEWVNISDNEFVHIPGNVKHAWRNESDKPVTGLIITTSTLGKFFSEIGRIKTDKELLPPTKEELEHFEKTAANYNHWLASPEENEKLGIKIF